jgi:hypothetical protein
VFLDRYEDDIIGHLIPNSTVWPATALLVAAFALRLRWIFVITAIYMLLDVLFINLGLYEHNWWSTWMTGVAIFTYCIAMKHWYRKMEDRRYIALRYIMFSMILSFLLFEPSALLLLLGKQACSAGWFANMFRDCVTFEFTYHFAIALVCAGFICLPERRIWKLAPFALVITCDFILLEAGILSFYNGWNFFYLMLTRAISLLLFIFLESRYSYKLKVNPRAQAAS